MNKQDTTEVFLGKKSYEDAKEEYAKTLASNIPYRVVKDTTPTILDTLNQFYHTTSISPNNLKSSPKVLRLVTTGVIVNAEAAEQNEGIDWKALHHALRAGFQLLEIYDRNDLRYPLEKKDFLIDVKQGKLDFSEVKSILEDLIRCVDDAASENKFNLPIEVDKEFWYNFVLKTYKEIWKEELK